MDVTLLGSGGDSGDELASAGWLVTCARCLVGEGVLECECCGDVLCPDCWSEGDPFCERCLGDHDDEVAARPVENVDVGERYL